MKQKEIIRSVTAILKENGLNPSQFEMEMITDECVRVNTHKLLTEEARQELSQKIEAQIDVANAFVI